MPLADGWESTIRNVGGAMAVLGALAAIVGALYLWLVGGRLAAQVVIGGLIGGLVGSVLLLLTADIVPPGDRPGEE